MRKCEYWINDKQCVNQATWVRPFGKYELWPLCGQHAKIVKQDDYRAGEWKHLKEKNNDRTRSGIGNERFTYGFVL